jgi:diguanylate cyclase (GGDEF)-like protein/PAS domain S-box-containing protein
MVLCPRETLRRNLLIVILLSGLAAWATLHSPTIFFDSQILLGPSLGVLALMEFGWLGLPVGITAAAMTIPLWGHPWAIPVLLAQLLWQQLFLSACNGGPTQVGNGRIVLATIAFWVALGLPFKALLYTWQLQLDWQSMSTLAVKEAVVSVVNASLALLTYLALQGLGIHRQRRDLSLRGISFAGQLLMISLPGMLIIAATGQQITDLSIAQFRAGLNADSKALLVMLNGQIQPPPDLEKLATAIAPSSGEPIAFAIESQDGQQLISNPSLFQRLQTEYSPNNPLPLNHDPQLSLLAPKGTRASVSRSLNSYWRYQQQLSPEAESRWPTITVVKSARSDMGQLVDQMRPAMQIQALLLIGAALASELSTTLLSRQFKRTLRSFSATVNRGHISGAMPLLQPSNIQELNGLVNVINKQAVIVNQLSEELQTANNNLRISEQQHRLLADNALDVITIMDDRHQVTYISPSIEQLRGWTPHEVISQPLCEQMKAAGWQELQRILHRIEQARETNEPLPRFRLELEMSHKYSGWVWTDATISCMVSDDNQHVATLMVYRNISDQKRRESQLREQAHTDELTGLLNRRAMLAHTNELLNHFNHNHVNREHLCPSSSREIPALLFCDLDLFKDINDSFGHAVGDAVLQVTAQRIRHMIREQDTAARIGGDELVVILNGVSHSKAALSIARKIQQAIAEPIVLEGQRVSITASMGITLARPGEDTESLIARSDQAMYQAKRLGRGRIIQIE